MLLESFYHRAQAPWVYQVADEEVEVAIRIGKNKVESINLEYGDALGLYIDGAWVKNVTPMYKAAETTFHEIWIGRMKNHSKRFRYAFNIKGNDGAEFLVGETGVLGDQPINSEGNGFTFSYWQKENFLNTPEWFRKVNWYQIFPDRFNKVGNEGERFADWNKIKPEGHELYGGNIEGMIAKLDYIKGLGFNGIYLTPIFDAPNSSHRYATKDYNKIDPILGDDSTFKKLIDEAHKRGIRVMLDAVFNHIGAASDQWQDVLKNGKDSKYADWFWINDWSNLKQPHEYNRDFQTKYPYETFSYVSDMPRLNWSNPGVEKYLLDASTKWTKMGIDGWRLDVSFEPSNNFWRNFKRTVTSINEEIAIIGEVWWDSINFLAGDMWHGVMNYPLRKIILDYFSSKMGSEEKQKFVWRFNEISFQYTPEQQWGMFNLLSSHDTARAITLFKNDEQKYKDAMTMMFMHPGSTSTYYGEEIGLEGEHDPDNRRPMPWGESRIDLIPFFKELNKRKQEYSNNANIHDRVYAILKDDEIQIMCKDEKIN